MNTILISIIAILLAYLLGSIPFAVVVSRLFGLSDPRSYGSKNPGATNVLRSGNKRAAALTLLGDMAKGFLAVYVAQKIAIANGWFAEGTVSLVALAVFLGHVFPIFLKFKGGKGVATAAGVLFAVSWKLGLVTIATWLAIAYIFRYSSLAAIIAAIVAPLAAFMILGSSEMSFSVLALAAVLIAKHAANLGRLLNGSESKIGGKSSEPGTKQTDKNRKK